MLEHRQPIRFAEEEKPKLIVVIDTEEEFDWFAEPDRQATAVSSMQYIHRCQDIFDEYGITPCYVVDYPIASQEPGYAALKTFQDSGRCEIGAHLHPWVNPPFDEELTRSNMFPGNLDKALEKAKLSQLTDIITQNFGQRPTTYKAGRYGIGPNTEAMLVDLGYDIDLSICPPVDYSHEQGPNFSQAHAEPNWFGPNNSILEIPVSGAFTGCLGSLAKPVYELGNRLKPLKVPAIFSRLNIVDRLMLSPEGFDTNDHIKLTRFLYKQGIRTFTWSFHNPSLVPGLSPYVHTEADLTEFLGRFRRFFDFFFTELGGVASSPKKLKSQLEALS